MGPVPAGVAVRIGPEVEIGRACDRDIIVTPSRDPSAFALDLGVFALGVPAHESLLEIPGVLVEDARQQSPRAPTMGSEPGAVRPQARSPALRLKGPD